MGDDAGDAGQVFVIESIVTFSRTRNRFFLSWQGYPPTSNTWEPFKSFSDKETPLNFLIKLKSCGAICDNCIKIAKSSSSLSPASICECARRRPSPISTPGKRAIDMLKAIDSQNSSFRASPGKRAIDKAKQADSPNTSGPVQSKRPRAESSPDSPSNASTPIAKSSTKSLASVVASYPSSSISKKVSSRPKTPPKIPFQEGIDLSDDDNEPMQPHPSILSTKKKKEPSPVTKESVLRPHNDPVIRVESFTASSPKCSVASSSPTGIAAYNFAHFAISHQCPLVAAEHPEDATTSEPQPDSPSLTQRRVFHFKDFQNSSQHQKRLADIASPMEVTQEQKDALGRLNHMDLKNMGIWQTQDLLLIMKKLTIQVKTEEIKGFFVRLQQ